MLFNCLTINLHNLNVYKNIKNMNGGCLHLSTGAFIQKLVHAGHQSSEVNHFPQEQLVGEEKLLSKTGL